ncbi:MAG TPA: hypothetical protein VJ385_17005 [Fibrobacteria bacterium]|nr:hypothetical protein [Fibrobacteria bacterium]
MEISLVVIISIAVMVALVLLAAETVREFKRMDKNPGNFTGSDRFAGTAE